MLETLHVIWDWNAMLFSPRSCSPYTVCILDLQLPNVINTSLYFDSSYYRAVWQLHAARCTRIPQLLAQHHCRPAAGGEEPGEAAEWKGSTEWWEWKWRRRWKRQQHRRRWNRGKVPADLGARDLPRHADQWNAVPELWSGESEEVEWIISTLNKILGMSVFLRLCHW